MGRHQRRPRPFSAERRYSGLLPSTPYMSLAPGKAGTIWVATGEADLRRVENRKFLDRLPEEFSRMKRRVNCVYRATSGILWMATAKGLSWMTGGQQVKDFAYPETVGRDVEGNGTAVTMTDARPGGMWVSILGDGVYRFAGGNWTSLAALGGPGGVALSSFTDPDGHVWLGLLNGTLVKINDHEIRVLGRRMEWTLARSDVFTGATPRFGLEAIAV